MNDSGDNRLSPQNTTGEGTRKGRELFQLVAQHSLEGFERSFKMSEGSLLWNRFLVGVHRADVGRADLLSTCEKMGMPAGHVKVLKDSLSEANQIFFGFEENERSCVYKVYLEFWDKVKREIHSDPDNTFPELLHVGLKWDPEDPGRSAVARYKCFPLLSGGGILRRMAALYEGQETAVSLEAARAIIHSASNRAAEEGCIGYACNRAADEGCIYLEVQEGDSPRRSFDVNLYKASLQLQDIGPLLIQAAERYSIPVDRFNSLFSHVRTKDLGHVAGGIDRRGKDFLTTNYEDSIPKPQPPGGQVGEVG